MISYQLFFKRLINEWKFQANVLKMIFDWTVLIYIIMPGIVVSFFIYRSWWVETPDWIVGIPVGVIFILCYLFSWTGQIRTYVQDADQMFIIKHEQLFHNLKITGLIYTIFASAVKLAMILFVTAPLLVNYYLLSLEQIVLIYLIFLSLKSLIMGLKVEFKKVPSQLVQKIITTISFMLIGVLVSIVYQYWLANRVLTILLICVVTIGVAAILIIPYVKKRSEIATHLMIEKIERMKYIDFIYSFSYDLEKTNVITRKRPLLFRKSQRIFKKRTEKLGFLELFIKVFIRNPMHITGYFQIIGIAMFAIISLPPMWLKLTIFISTIIMIGIWSSLIWEKIILAHPLTKKYGFYDGYFKAKKVVNWTLVIIAIFFLLGAFYIEKSVSQYVDQFLEQIS